MKIRLVDQTTYDVVRNDIIDGCLEIEIQDKTAEELQTIFSNASNLSHIDLLTDDGDVYGQFDNWTKYGGVLLNGDSCVVMLTQPVDINEQRLTTAESNALSALSAANSANEIVTNMSTQVSNIAENIGSMNSDIESTKAR